MRKALVLLLLCVPALSCAGDSSAEQGPGGHGAGRQAGGRPGGGRPASTSQEMQEISVKAFRVEKAPISTYILSNTSLEPIRRVSLFSRVNSLVTELNVEEGDFVREGQVLARLDDREIRNEYEQAGIAVDQAEIQVRQAEVKSKQSAANHERSESLRKQKLISQQDFDQSDLADRTDSLAYDVSGQQLEAARARLAASKLQVDYTEIVSSIDGVVTERLVDIGDRVNVNEELFKLEDFTPLWARIFIPEKDLSQIRIGQVGKVRLEAYPEESFEGRIKMISPTIDATSGTVKVTLEMSDPRRRLRPGMFGLVSIATNTHSNALVIPKKAVLRERDESRVFVINEDQTVNKVTVGLGFSEQDRVEVLSGLSAGQTIVTVGQEGLNEGYPVRVLAWESGEPVQPPAEGTVPRVAPQRAERESAPGQMRGEGRRERGGQRGEAREGGRGGFGGGGRDMSAMLDRMLERSPDVKKAYEERLAKDPELATDTEKRQAFMREMFAKMRGRNRQ